MTDTIVQNEAMESKKIDRRKKEYLAQMEAENKLLKNELEMVKTQVSGMQSMVSELLKEMKFASQVLKQKPETFTDASVTSTPATSIPAVPTVYAVDQVKLRQDQANKNQKWKKEKEIRTSWIEIKGQKKVQVTQISYQHEFAQCGCGNAPCQGQLEKGNRGQLYLGKAKPNEQQHKVGEAREHVISRSFSSAA